MSGLRYIVASIALLLWATPAFSQADKGQIAGRLASARGPLPGVEVRVKNATTDEVVLVTTSRDGEYAAAVKPGTYEVFASPTGYAAFVRRQIEVRAGATVRADGVLGDNPNAGTPGEIFFLYSRDEKKAPSGPTPKTADGKPDLSGVWYPGPDLEPETPPFQPWAEAAAKKNASHPGDDPRAQCLPTGVHAHQRPRSREVRANAGSAPDPGGRKRARNTSGLHGWPASPGRPVADVAGSFSGHMGSRHAGGRHDRIERQGLAR